MAKLIIEIDDTVDSKQNIKRYADALTVLSGGGFDEMFEDYKKVEKIEPPKAPEKVTVTDTTEEKTETAAEKKKRLAAEKKSAEAEAAKNAKNDDVEKVDDEEDFGAEEKTDDEASETELSHDEIVALIRPLLSSKAKLDGGRDKIRAEFTKHGASGLGNLSAEKAWPMYEFLRDLA